MISVRHGLMIIGETLSGKTSAYKALSRTLNDMSELKELNHESKVRYLKISVVFIDNKTNLKFLFSFESKGRLSNNKSKISDHESIIRTI